MGNALAKALPDEPPKPRRRGGRVIAGKFKTNAGQLITTAELAKQLGYTQRSVQYWCRAWRETSDPFALDGVTPRMRDGRYMFDQLEVIAFLARRARGE